MKKYFIISAVGANVPGIVAAVSREIHACGCNFEDSRMSLLGNHFALMILVAGEGEETGDKLEASCECLRNEKGLSVTLFPVEDRDQETGEGTEPNYEIRVKGVDRMGIVYRTSQLLASRNINIVDFTTHLEPSPDQGTPIFTMYTRVVVPQEVEGEALRRDLESLAEDLSETVSLSRIFDP